MGSIATKSCDNRIASPVAIATKSCDEVVGWGVRKKRLARGTPVVDAVLAATVEELGRAGYGALTIEAVAARAKVAKTTVYRRWPTREKLVRAALTQLVSAPPPLPDGGSLRADLRAIARATADSLRSPAGQTLVRLGYAGPLEPEVMEIFRAVAAAQNATWAQVLERAIQRGELTRGADLMLLLEAIGGALMHHIFLSRRPADEAFLSQLVDVLLDGALSRKK